MVQGEPVGDAPAPVVAPTAKRPCPSARITATASAAMARLA